MYSDTKKSVFFASPSLSVAVITAIFILAWVIQANILLNWDVSWLMHASSRLLNGGTYQKDFFEINPPMILYLSIPPVLLTKYLSFPIIFSLRFYLFLLGSVSLAICYVLASSIFQAKEALLKNIFLSALAIVFFILPIYEFGQREHLLVILSMPYLMCVTCRIQNKPIPSCLAAAIGLMAGLGFGIKPFFLLTPAFIELYFIFYAKNLFAWKRLENLTMSLVLFIYVVSIFYFFRDYLTIIIPVASNSYYRGVGEPAYKLFLHPLVLFCGLTLLFYLIEYARRSHQTLSTVICISMIASIFSYLLQHTSTWYYHLIPAFSMAVLLLTLLFGELIQQTRISKLHSILIAAMGVFFFQFLFSHDKIIWTVLVFEPRLFFGFFACLFLVTALSMNQNLYKTLLSVMFVIGFSFLFSNCIMLSAWNTYRFGMTLLCLFGMYSLLAPKSRKLHSTFVAIIGTLVFAFPIYYFYTNYAISIQKRAVLEPLISFLQKNARHKPVYFFTEFCDMEFPAVDYAGAIPTTRLQFLGWIPSILDPLHHPSSNQKLTQYYQQLFTRIVYDDLEMKKPLFIFMDVSVAKGRLKKTPFDQIQFFSRDAEFRSLWKSYKYVTTIEKPNAYKVQVFERISTNELRDHT